MKRIFVFFTGLFYLISVGGVSADTINVNFTRIDPANAPIALNLAAQLHLIIADQSSAAELYGQTISANQVLFAFTNNVGIDSSISEIYLDDAWTTSGLPGTPEIANPYFVNPIIVNSLGGHTDFALGANPGVLPGGNNLLPSFEESTFLSVDAQGNPSEGIDTSADILGLIYEVVPSTSILGGIRTALDAGDFRIGMHVRSIDPGGYSDAFVNTTIAPVPEPATMILFGTGLVGLVGALRRKKR